MVSLQDMTRVVNLQVSCLELTDYRAIVAEYSVQHVEQAIVTTHFRKQMDRAC